MSGPPLLGGIELIGMLFPLISKSANVANVHGLLRKFMVDVQKTSIVEPATIPDGNLTAAPTILPRLLHKGIVLGDVTIRSPPKVAIDASNVEIVPSAVSIPPPGGNDVGIEAAVFPGTTPHACTEYENDILICKYGFILIKIKKFLVA